VCHEVHHIFRITTTIWYKSSLFCNQESWATITKERERIMNNKGVSTGNQAELLTDDSLKAQNLGFPLLPHLRRCAPFFIATIA
jgi:hypothetical protein